MTRSLTFDEAAHTYSLNGRCLPGITSRLTKAGLLDPAVYQGFENARLRGTAVHMATQFLDEGTLDESTVDPAIANRVEAWWRFKTDTQYELHEVPELLVASEMMGYATQIDRVMRPAGNKHGPPFFIINLKTSTVPAVWWKVQLAGEAMAYAEWQGVPLFGLRRLSVRLLDDGTYKLDEHKDRHDYETWRAAVEIAAWKERHGLA